MIIEGTFDNKTVKITFNGEGQPCHLVLTYLPPIDMVLDRGEFKNPRMLSAQLRGDLGFKDCCELLYRHHIPESSGLWDMNHDGYPGAAYLERMFGKG